MSLTRNELEEIWDSIRIIDKYFDRRHHPSATAIQCTKEIDKIKNYIQSEINYTKSFNPDRNGLNFI